MKSLKSLPVLIACFFLTAALQAQVNKKWNKVFPLSESGSLKIDNQFGAVEVTTWNERKVQIDVTIELDGKSEKKLNELLEKIEIQDKSNSNLVYVKTEIGKLKSNNNEISIDYAVKLPQDLNIEINNSFGSVALPNLSGSTKLKIDYGSLKAGELSNKKNEIVLSFSSGSIESLAEAITFVDYGSLKVDNVDMMTAKTSFSQISIDKAGSVDVKSEYDSFEIDAIDFLTVDGQFTNFEIDELISELNADVSYSEFEIDAVSSNFQSIEFKSEMGGIELDLDSEASFTYDLFSNMGGIDIPSEFTNSTTIKEDFVKHYIGSKGDNPGKRMVKIKTSYGGIEIN